VAPLRARVPKVAAEVHRALLADLAGGATGFGTRRQQRSWLGVGGRRAAEGAERNTQVLEAILARGESGPLAPAAPPQSRPELYGAPAAALPATADGRTGFTGWLANPTDATVPVPAHMLNGGGNQSSPFASLATGAQSAIFGGATSIADRPTGPLPAHSRPASAPASPPTPARGLADDLYQLYGDYLRDMHPELAAAPVPSAPAPVATPPRPQPQPAPASAPGSAYAAAAPASADTQIFFQLRYQLEAFVRRAARSYGVRGRTDDPASVLDALRRSGFVDESDLRLAESILAITDKVISSGVAGMDDFRQALMLYLLYHRSHLGS
jgi:hypothetical protein